MTETDQSINQSINPGYRGSLWDLIIGGVTHQPINHLWSMLSDRMVIRAMMVNQSTNQSFNQYPMKTIFTASSPKRQDNLIVRDSYGNVAVPMEEYIDQSTNQSIKRQCMPRVIKLRHLTVNLQSVLQRTPHLEEVWVHYQPEDPSINPSLWPQSIKSMTLLKYYRRFTLDTFPVTLQDLRIEARHVMPKGYEMKFRKTDESFDLPEHVFPPNLKRLALSGIQLTASPSKTVFPRSLEALDYGCNQPLIAGSLPENLEQFFITFDYNHPLPVGLFGNSLKTLFLATSNFNQPLSPGLLPEGLETLVFGEGYKMPLKPGVIPASLKTLVFHSQYYDSPFTNVFPPNSQLKTLSLLSRTSHQFNRPINKGDLPPSLEFLNLQGAMKFDQPFKKGSLPAGLKKLWLGRGWRRQFKSEIWSSCPLLEELSLYESTQWKEGVEPNTLPTSLKKFHLPRNYKRVVKVDALPSSFCYITIDDSKKLKGKIPDHLVVNQGSAYSDDESDDEREECDPMPKVSIPPQARPRDEQKEEESPNKKQRVE